MNISNTKDQQSASKRPLQEIKIILIGESNVGKTSLIQQYLTGEVSKNNRPTISCDFFCKTTELEEYNSRVQVQIWDTAGQERFKSISTPFYRQSDICVLTYDINQSATFETLLGWKNMFLEHANPEKFGQFPFILIGNKLDLVQGNKRVQKTVIDGFIESKKIIAGFECSAFNKQEVDDIFEQIILEAYKYKYDNPIRDQKQNNQSINEDDLRQDEQDEDIHNITLQNSKQDKKIKQQSTCC